MWLGARIFHCQFNRSLEIQRPTFLPFALKGLIGNQSAQAVQGTLVRFAFGKQIVTPVNERTERLLAGQCGTAAPTEQAETIIQSGENLVQ